jgi:hypothetical protein
VLAFPLLDFFACLLEEFELLLWLLGAHLLVANDGEPMA